MKVFSPGPPKLPNTFWAPWKTKTAAKANLIGTVAHDEVVEMIFLNTAGNPFKPGKLEKRHK